MKTNLPLVALGLTLAAVFALPAFAVDTEKTNADQILRQMSSKLGSARQFSFKAHRETSASLVTGLPVPRDAQIEVTVLRPNKISAKSASKGDVRHFYADGKNLTLFDVTKNFYSTVPMHTSIDGLVEEVGAKYGFTPPLAELAISNVYEDIRYKAQSISYLGRDYYASGFLGLGGVECYRIALSGKVADAELWVAVKDQLPRKLGVTYKNRAGKPQMTVEFSGWNLSAKVTDQDFVFVPPKGALKIPMVTTAEMAAAVKKAASKKH